MLGAQSSGNAAECGGAGSPALGRSPGLRILVWEFGVKALYSGFWVLGLAYFATLATVDQCLCIGHSHVILAAYCDAKSTPIFLVFGRTLLETARFAIDILGRQCSPSRSALRVANSKWPLLSQAAVSIPSQ